MGRLGNRGCSIQLVGMMDKKLREDVADVLQDFVAVLTEATSDKISLPPDTQCWEWEAYVMRRLSPLIARL